MWYEQTSLARLISAHCRFHCHSSSSKTKLQPNESMNPKRSASDRISTNFGLNYDWKQLNFDSPTLQSDGVGKSNSDRHQLQSNQILIDCRSNYDRHQRCQKQKRTKVTRIVQNKLPRRSTVIDCVLKILPRYKYKSIRVISNSKSKEYFVSE